LNRELQEKISPPVRIIPDKVASLQLKNLHLINFKNHSSRKLSFPTAKMLIVGKNGVGKTNLLDAIYFASLTKSAFHADKQIVKTNENFCRIEAKFEIEDDWKHLVITYSPQEKKNFVVNGYTYETLAEYIGQFPVVLVAPNDTDLIREGSEERRRFFDTLLCQIDKIYLQKLSLYNKILKQRNSLLQQFKERKKADYTLIEVYDEQILPLMRYISRKRKYIVERLLPTATHYYKMIAADAEQIHLSYDSEVLDDDFEKKFKESFTKDCLFERTTMGIHKDDYSFILQENSLKKFGSQGQQKSFLVALKLATFKALEIALQKKPILLLDDILDKLDHQRSQLLLKMVAEEEFGQVIVTEANQERVALINQDKKWWIQEITNA
jgi:DNA replication and repair protein RecF